MATLNSLGLNEVFENPAILGEGISIHQWLISRIKVNNLTSSVVTNGLLFDLQSHVHIKRSRHDKHDPKRQLTKAEMTHILCFLICRMAFEEVTEKIVRGVWNKMPTEESPTALWKAGIDFIKKHERTGGAEGADHSGEAGRSSFRFYLSEIINTHFTLRINTTCAATNFLSQQCPHLWR